MGTVENLWEIMISSRLGGLYRGRSKGQYFLRLSFIITCSPGRDTIGVQDGSRSGPRYASPAAWGQMIRGQSPPESRSAVTISGRSQDQVASQIAGRWPVRLLKMEMPTVTGGHSLPLFYEGSMLWENQLRRNRNRQKLS